VGLPRGGHAAIVGTGLAGTGAAVALHRRGWKTTLIDRHADIAEDASGNSVGVFMPRLTAAPNLDGRYYAAAWRMMLDQLETYADAGIAIGRDRCGVLQLAVHGGDDERQAAIMASAPLPEPLMFRVGAAEASDIAGHKVPHGALYFPQGGWLNPKLLCQAAAKSGRAVLGLTAAAVRRAGGSWEVLDDAGSRIVAADIVVFAGGMRTTSIPQLSWLPLAARRGQITFVDASARSATLRSVLGYGGTLTPAHRGRHCLGATFDWTDNALGAQVVRQVDHERNFADLAAALPTIAQTMTSTAVDGRAAIRCTTPDHLPVVGPVPDQAAYLKDFSDLRHGHAWIRYPRATYQSGLYVLAGLGSRGLVSAPLASEILACHVSGDPWPVARDLVNALHPGRFLVRDLKRLNV
jgi:tRNA 5-methylaminomethyl-2-thiouridine biosynthesis bifunctional protein